MELPQRKGEDRFLPAGRYRAMEEALRGNRRLSEVRSLVVSACDRRTRMLPFILIDGYTVPCGPRSIAGALYDAGMVRTRFVFQLWNPNIRPAEARLEGQPMDMLLVSSMQVHSAAAFRLVEDAWRMGEDRPLILAGGPKACYEPFDYFGLGPNHDQGADVVVTGEESVLLELLEVLTAFGAGPGAMRAAFERARQAGALREVPGLVYAEDGRHDGKNLVNTGTQRLLRDLDELPMPVAGFRTLEPPHRGRTLARETYPLHKAGARNMVTALLITRGCKFSCHYCPIPAYNYHSYRRKSVARVVAELIECRRDLNTRYVFGADDNFFNNRKYSEELLTTIAATMFNGKPLGRGVRIGTESTVIDAYKCRDLFPMARHGRGGLSALWMGVEDLSAVLVDKGQAPDITRELFARMIENDICPMVMMMHHDDQPLHSPGKMTGLIEQVKYLRKSGAMGMQITLANPAIGSRWVNQVFNSGLLYDTVGGKKIEDRDFDGNHIIASVNRDPYRMQMNFLRGYAAFYNPWNLFQSLRVKGRFLRRKHIFWQLWGMISLVVTAWKVKGYAWRLWCGSITRVKGWPAKYLKGGSPYAEAIAMERSQPPAPKPGAGNLPFPNCAPAETKTKTAV